MHNLGPIARRPTASTTAWCNGPSTWLASGRESRTTISPSNQDLDSGILCEQHYTRNRMGPSGQESRQLLGHDPHLANISRAAWSCHRRKATLSGCLLAVPERPTWCFPASRWFRCVRPAAPADRRPPYPQCSAPTVLSSVDLYPRSTDDTALALQILSPTAGFYASQRV